MYEKINEPLSIRGLKLKNRIVFAPTTMGLSEEEYLERLGIIAALSLIHILVKMKKKIGR